MKKNDFNCLSSICDSNYSFLDKLISFKKFLYSTEIDFNDIRIYIDGLKMSQQEKEMLKFSIKEHEAIMENS